MSAPPPYQSRPTTPGADSLAKPPVDFYVNPTVADTSAEDGVVVNVVETSTDDGDGYKIISATEGSKSFPHCLSNPFPIGWSS